LGKPKESQSEKKGGGNFSGVGSMGVVEGR